MLCKAPEMCHYFFWFEPAFIEMRDLNQNEFLYFMQHITRNIYYISDVSYLSASNFQSH